MLIIYTLDYKKFTLKCFVAQYGILLRNQSNDI